MAMQETFKTRENGYFIFIQIPVLYIMAVVLPGMYMMFPYIQWPIIVFSSLNLLIPLIAALIDRTKQKMP
jgi:hypothetical protein